MTGESGGDHPARSPDQSTEQSPAQSPAQSPEQSSAQSPAQSEEPTETVRVEPDGDGAIYPSHAPPSEEFGWEGWVVVGVLILSFLVVPPAIIYLPEAQDVVRSLGLTLRDAYLALPMLPAILLGVTAVWAAVRHRRRQ